MPEKESKHKEMPKIAGRPDVKWKSDKSQMVQIKEAIKKLDKKKI